MVDVGLAMLTLSLVLAIFADQMRQSHQYYQILLETKTFLHFLTWFCDHSSSHFTVILPYHACHTQTHITSYIVVFTPVCLWAPIVKKSQRRVVNVVISCIRRCNPFNPYSAVIDFRRQNRTSVDVRFWPLKVDPRTVRVNIRSGRRPIT